MLKSRSEKFYDKVISEDLILLYRIKNIAQLPRLDTATVSYSSKQFASNQSYLLESFCKLFFCCIKNVQVKRADQSIAFLNIREKDILRLKLTLRKNDLWLFLDKLSVFLLPKQSSAFFVNEASLKQNKKMSSLSSFTIGSNDCLAIGIFPEVDFLFQSIHKSKTSLSTSALSSRFSFLCFIRTFYKKKDLQNTHTQRDLMQTKENQNLQYSKKNRKLITSVYHKNQMKKVFVSSFQLPIGK